MSTATGVIIGERKRITTADTPFSDPAGTPTDTTAVLKQRTPAGVESTLSTTHSGDGVYYADVTFTTAGRWYFRITGTGAVTAADELEVVVSRSAFTTP